MHLRDDFNHFLNRGLRKKDSGAARHSFLKCYSNDKSLGYLEIFQTMNGCPGKIAFIDN